MFVTILAFIFILIAAPYSLYRTTSTLIHEIGHYLILRYVYKDHRSGVIIGDINGKPVKSTRFLGVPISFYSRPKEGKLTRGIAFPWDIVYSGPKHLRILYSIAGPASEFLVGILIFLLGLYVVHASHFPNYLYFVLTLLMLCISVNPILVSVVKLCLSMHKQPIQIVNVSMRELTGTQEAYTDGRLIRDNSKLWTIICFLVLIIAILFCFATVYLWCISGMAWAYEIEYHQFVRIFLDAIKFS